MTHRVTASATMMGTTLRTTSTLSGTGANTLRLFSNRKGPMSLSMHWFFTTSVSS